MGLITDKLHEKYGRWVLTTTEVAEELRISVMTLKRRVKAQKMIPPLQQRGLGGFMQWNLKDIAKYLGDTDL